LSIIAAVADFRGVFAYPVSPVDPSRLSPPIRCFTAINGNSAASASLDSAVQPVQFILL
jgi:hypothetical protein